jgi:hypothetical protein
MFNEVVFADGGVPGGNPVDTVRLVSRGWREGILPTSMDDRRARIAKNEALFREVNEQIDALNDAGPQADAFPVVCECGSNACAETINIGRADYEAVRLHPDRFLIKPGHEFDEVETVVEKHADYAVVAKKPGEPRLMAEVSDPRQ